jgi:hypothetical protein
MPITDTYEVSSEGSVRHWGIPYARCLINPPIPTEPTEVVGLPVGFQLNGTCLTVSGAPDNIAIVDFTPSMVYHQQVRTVLTYAGAEASWGDLHIGDPVYYDTSVGVLPAGVRLSTSPIQSGGGANSLFGWIVATDQVDEALFPKLAGGAGNTHWCGVMQKGA